MVALPDAPTKTFTYVAITPRVNNTTGEVVDNSAGQLRHIRDMVNGQPWDRPWCLAADAFSLVAKFNFDLCLANADGASYRYWRALCARPDPPDLVERTRLNAARLSARFKLINVDVIADDGRKWRYRKGEVTEDITPTGVAIQRTPDEVPVSITIRRKHAPDEES